MPGPCSGSGSTRATSRRWGARSATSPICCPSRPSCARPWRTRCSRPSEKRAVLEQLLPRVTPTPEVQRFVLLLLDRRRIVLLPAIARAYRDMADAHLGRVRAQVTSAEPLAPAVLDRVRRSLEQRTGKQVIVETAVDPELVGGLVRAGRRPHHRRQRADATFGPARQTLELTERLGKHRHANPRRRDQPDHPQGDRGLRQEGLRHGDRHRARGRRRHRPRLRARVGDGRRAPGLRPRRRRRAGAEPRGGQRRRRAPRQLRGGPRGRSGQAHRARSPRCRSATRSSAAW